ncbi:hypothetical protein COO59_09525 [Mixta theicola]|uniref:Uncharacterized protein n=1 Tax=Mixta theicola TaxID=1458355 RepID=A0A2K1Q9M4_9GAMM|nr:hypothetical protein COO59_09525 [Mixta theicola]GLR07646.1 hypothetical protein GCM10007905_03650 [Mixta theicola]
MNDKMILITGGSGDGGRNRARQPAGKGVGVDFTRKLEAEKSGKALRPEWARREIWRPAYAGRRGFKPSGCRQ